MATDADLILAIDDDPAICEVLQDLLRAEGYSAECCPDGPRGLARIAAGGVALVLLDWMLPGMNGAEVLRRITEGYGSIPVVIVTAVGRTLLPDPPSGAAAVLHKPFDMEELLMLVDSMDRRERNDAAPPRLCRRTGLSDWQILHPPDGKPVPAHDSEGWLNVELAAYLRDAEGYPDDVREWYADLCEPPRGARAAPTSGCLTAAHP